MNTLYTVGHSNHSPDVFLQLLNLHAISAVADVRSSPYSQYVPEFNRPVLENGLREADITYVFLGKELGARRTEEKSFVDGIASYDSIAGLPLFRAGLDRLFRGMEQYRVALMCSEADPITCHRTILICHEIKKLRPHQSIIHILNDGNTETHEEAEQRLIAAHKLQPELFGELNSPEGLLDKAYALQAAKIAYHKGEEEP